MKPFPHLRVYLWLKHLTYPTQGAQPLYIVHNPWHERQHIVHNVLASTSIYKVSERDGAMQCSLTALAAVYFILPLMVWSPPLGGASWCGLLKMCGRVWFWEQCDAPAVQRPIDWWIHCLAALTWGNEGKIWFPLPPLNTCLPWRSEVVGNAGDSKTSPAF